MKVNFSIARPPSSPFRPQVHGHPAPRNSARGIALIVTLIMLSVITFMTVTFLVLSQRERGSVTTSTDQLLAKQAADSAMERAKIELIAPMLALTNSQVYSLVVSTNFINRAGFDPGSAFNHFTNVNFDYRLDGSAMNPNERLWVLTNLFYNPRPPVFMTNRVTGRTEFRYYLDLNRNGVYDTNGFLPVIGNNGLPIVTAGVTNYGWFVGDPEWIGVLERPEMPYSSSNKFIARYAYLVVPAGKTLDVNYIHNQAKRPANVLDDGFLRNQGVGSYEINLAAFLTDLNTNIWNPAVNAYAYDPIIANASKGLGFEDASSFLRYRYANNWKNLTFPLLTRDDSSIDEYANGNVSGLLMTNIVWANDLNDTGDGFPGADNPRHFFTTQEFFDRNKVTTLTARSFVDRLSEAGTNVNSYDRYTYYRMLAQLGTDSEPDQRMNLNYVNLDSVGRAVPGMETNLVAWTPLQFFTNAADRLLREQFPNSTLSITNIPVFRNNTLIYSPDVHRLLQLAANLYEATTNKFYPTMYRPYFTKVGTGTNAYVYISGYTNVVNPVIGDPVFTLPVDLNEYVNAPSGITTDTHVNIYGVPWVIGARKGFPNLNEVSANSRFDITRRIRVTRPTRSSAPKNFTYQQQLLMTLRSELGVEAWNSYHTNFLPGAHLYVSGTFSYALTNSRNLRLARTNSFNPPFTDLPTWPGYGPLNEKPSTPPAPQSFVTLVRTNFTILTNSVYDQVGNRFDTNLSIFEPLQLEAVRWGVSMTNHVRAIIADRTGHVFDYVQLQGPATYRDLTAEIRTVGYGVDGLWNTNLTTGTPPIFPEGVNYQLTISRGDPTIDDFDWRNYGVGQAAPGNIKNKEIAEFKAFYIGQGTTYHDVGAENPPGLTIQAPFTPTRSVQQLVTWQANDPLVHYMGDDLGYLAGTLPFDEIKPPGIQTNLLPNIGRLNDRYMPWGGNPVKGPVGNDAYNSFVKDPLVRMSDDWDFPTNRFANLGWVGRVHRGTPWQTVYMKAGNVIGSQTGVNDWRNWTGHANNVIASNTAPINDRMIFDLFTTTPSDNASRGRLSVNQENLAAWSAVLSGVIVQTNSLGGYRVIQPVAISPEVASIVQGINQTRANTNPTNGLIFPNGQFAHIGDVLATPQLTQQSPFLPFFAPTNMQDVAEAKGLSDAVVERIPQQIMSLLGFSAPRFVIYAYGQTLRPAEQSIIRNFGPFYGICTNYQVTAETATRAVVRVEGSFNPRNATNSVPALHYPPRLVVEQFNVLPPD